MHIRMNLPVKHKLCLLFATVGVDQQNHVYLILISFLNVFLIIFRKYFS